MATKLLKDLDFGKIINSGEALTEAGKEILTNYRGYMYSNPATCGIVNGFCMEASKYTFDSGLSSILEQVNEFIKKSPISWKLASACESIMNNNSTYSYINKLGVGQVEKLLEMQEQDVVSYIKAGSLKSIQYIPEFRQICKEVYKTTVCEHQAVNYMAKHPISYCIVEKEANKHIFNAFGKTYIIEGAEIKETKCDDKTYNEVNALLEMFSADETGMWVEYNTMRGETMRFTIVEGKDGAKDHLDISKNGKVTESFEEPAKFMEHANMISRPMMTNEKVRFMTACAQVNKVFEGFAHIMMCDNVKCVTTNTNAKLVIIEGKENVFVDCIHSTNTGAWSKSYEYVAEALNDVVKASGIDLKPMYEERINEDVKKMNPEAQAMEQELKESQKAQYDIRKKKIALLAEQYKNDPIKLALLNKVAKDLKILENKTM